MLEACLLMAYVGVFCVLLGVSEIIVIRCMYIKYKRRNGKLSFKEYKKRWS